MDDFFSGNDSQNVNPPAYEPPQEEAEAVPQLSGEEDNSEEPALNFGSYPSAEPQNDPNDNEFDDFEEDEMTKRIREEEERVQARLREKSEKEWSDKQQRQSEGRRQLDEFLTRKEQEKKDRAVENERKEQSLKEELRVLNVQAGWRKVVSNINLRQGQYKGTKDINRMRESILHKRQDEK